MEKLKNLMKHVDSEELWKKILLFKRSEFPNVWALVEILIYISGSNSTVERAFSTLTNILTEKRLSMKHKRLEQILIISSNEKNWTVQEETKLSKEPSTSVWKKDGRP